MNKDFITATPDTGSGDATVNVVAAKNNGAARSTSLKIAGGGITKTVTISQSAGAVNVIIVGENGNIIKTAI